MRKKRRTILIIPILLFLVLAGFLFFSFSERDDKVTGKAVTEEYAYKLTDVTSSFNPLPKYSSVVTCSFDKKSTKAIYEQHWPSAPDYFDPSTKTLFKGKPQHDQWKFSVTWNSPPSIIKQGDSFTILWVGDGSYLTKGDNLQKAGFVVVDSSSGALSAKRSVGDYYIVMTGYSRDNEFNYHPLLKKSNRVSTITVNANQDSLKKAFLSVSLTATSRTCGGCEEPDPVCDGNVEYQYNLVKKPVCNDPLVLDEQTWECVESCKETREKVLSQNIVSSFMALPPLSPEDLNGRKFALKNAPRYIPDYNVMYGGVG